MLLRNRRTSIGTNAKRNKSKNGETRKLGIATTTATKGINEIGEAEALLRDRRTLGSECGSASMNGAETGPGVPIVPNGAETAVGIEPKKIEVQPEDPVT